MKPPVNRLDKPPVDYAPTRRVVLLLALIGAIALLALLLWAAGG